MDTEAWSWGDLFELDVPVATEVNDLGEMIELRFAEYPDLPLLMAVFSPMPAGADAGDGPGDAVRLALERFAASRGLSRPITPALGADPHGLVAGHVAFDVDLHWEALAIAWNQHLVVAFAAASNAQEGIFARARDLVASLRPLELVVPTRLAAEAEGDF